MNKIMVIGSNSFSGSSFISYLLKLGYEIFGISRSLPPQNIMLPHTWNFKKGRFHFQQIDLNKDLESLEKLLKLHKISIIYNFAAQSMVGESWDKPDDWMQTNVVTISRIVQVLRHMDFIDKYIHITTPEVYGSTDGYIKEDAPFNPSTPYAVSRTAGDMILKIYQESFGIPVVLTRAANVYGPGQQLYRIIPKTIYFLLTGKKLELHGGGNSIRSFIHIDDVSSATLKIAQAGIIGHTYHISTDRSISIRDLVELICVMLGKNFTDHVDFSMERLGKDRAYLLDSSKLKSELLWADSISLETGIEQTSNWIRSNLDQLANEPTNYMHKS